MQDLFTFRESPWFRRLSLLLIAVGAWLSGELVQQHDDIWGRKGGGSSSFLESVCHATGLSPIDCRQTTRGAWSRITVPLPVPARDFTLSVRRVVVPVAFVGLSYFVFLAAWIVAAGGQRTIQSGWRRLPLRVARSGAAVSLFFVGLMVFGYAPWCVWCCVVHAINFALPLLIGRQLSRESAATGDWTDIRAPERRPHTMLPPRAVISTAAVALAVVFGLWMHRRAHLVFKNELNALRPYQHMVSAMRHDPDFLLREYFAQPEHNIRPRGGELSDARRPRLVVFTDFECPPCYCNARRIQSDIRSEFDGRLCVWVRHYPRCEGHRDGIEEKRHADACQAAHAVEAARRIGGESAFSQMHDLLFENRTRLRADLYVELARHIGLGPERFIMEMEGAEVQQMIANDVALARKLGVKGTPAMFLNGRRITPLLQCSTFWKAIADLELARCPSSAPPVVANAVENVNEEAFDDTSP